MNVNHLILDYVAICEKRGDILDFGEFIALWNAADALAQVTPEDSRDELLDSLVEREE